MSDTNPVEANNAIPGKSPSEPIPPNTTPTTNPPTDPNGVMTVPNADPDAKSQTEPAVYTEENKAKLISTANTIFSNFVTLLAPCPMNQNIKRIMFEHMDTAFLWLKEGVTFIPTGSAANDATQDTADKADAPPAA